MIRVQCPQPSPTSRSARQLRSQRAQATIEFLGSLPLVAFGALICVQALLVACAVVFAQAAVDRAARGAPRAQVAAAMPAGWRSGLRISTSAQRVRVTVRPPAVLPGAGRMLRIDADAEPVR